MRDLPLLYVSPTGVGSYRHRVVVFRNTSDASMVTLVDLGTECVIVTPTATHTIGIDPASLFGFEQVVDAYRRLLVWQQISYTFTDQDPDSTQVYTCVNLEGCTNEAALTGLTDMSPVGYDIDTVPATLAYVKNTRLW